MHGHAFVTRDSRNFYYNKQKASIKKITWRVLNHLHPTTLFVTSVYPIFYWLTITIIPCHNFAYMHINNSYHIRHNLSLKAVLFVTSRHFFEGSLDTFRITRFNQIMYPIFRVEWLTNLQINTIKIPLLLKTFYIDSVLV